MTLDEEKALVSTLKSKKNAIGILLARVEDHGGMTEQERKSLSWLFRSGASAVMALEPEPTEGKVPT